MFDLDGPLQRRPKRTLNSNGFEQSVEPRRKLHVNEASGNAHFALTMTRETSQILPDNEKATSTPEALTPFNYQC